MCGINLIIDRTGKDHMKSFKKMMDATRHRGPDSRHIRKIRKDGLNILLGTNRLRVVDQDEGSDQPFSDQEENYFLLYNGEIYNPEEIRNLLIHKGIRFRTFSDTEVLFHFLKQEGEAYIPFINGMYAFVFINLKNNSLTITRDPWGMKPLYYYLDERYFLLSSEIRGILSSGLVRKELNTSQIPYYLRYRYSSPSQTLLKNILQFEKGIEYRFDLKGFQLLKRPFTPDSAENRKAVLQKDIPSQVEQLLVDALISHTQSFRPAGIFLSGGVDSTLLLALSSHHNIPLPYVFSIVNKANDREFGTEDYRYARLAVKQYHPSAEFVEVDESLMNELDDFIGVMDHPIADPAYLLTYKLSAMASERTNVVLSGAGGDELFGGYNRHYAFYRYLKNYKRITMGISLMKRLNRYIPSLPFIYDRKKIVLSKKLLNKIDIDPWITYDNFLSFEKLHPSPIKEKEALRFSYEFLSDYLTMALERDRQEYLSDDVLAVNDRASMLESLEMRMPFLDYPLTSFVRQIPAGMLLARGQKWILKELLRKYDGDPYARRSKEGFGFPFGHWIRKPTHEYILQKLTRDNNLIYQFIERDEFLPLIQDHLSRREDNSQEIWSVLILTLWIEKNFN